MKKPRLTPEEAKALVEKHGSRVAVARALGVSPTTVSCWVDPEYRAKHNARTSEWRKEKRRSDPEWRKRQAEYGRKRKLDPQKRANDNAVANARRRRKYATDPEYRKRHLEQSARAQRKAMENPEYRERVLQYLRDYRANLSPEKFRAMEHGHRLRKREQRITDRLRENPDAAQSRDTLALLIAVTNNRGGN